MSLLESNFSSSCFRGTSLLKVGVQDLADPLAIGLPSPILDLSFSDALLSSYCPFATDRKFFCKCLVHTDPFPHRDKLAGYDSYVLLLTSERTPMPRGKAFLASGSFNPWDHVCLLLLLPPHPQAPSVHPPLLIPIRNVCGVYPGSFLLQEETISYQV